MVVFLEPIALYPMRDLHQAKDNAFLGTYPAPDERISLGEVGIHGEGSDVAIVTFGNGTYLSRQAQRRVADIGLKTRVIDLRWLAPLPAEDLLDAVAGCKNILIVDECRRTGGQSEGLVTFFQENGVAVNRIAAEDSFIATGPAYAASLPSADQIVAKLCDLMGKPAGMRDANCRSDLSGAWDLQQRRTRISCSASQRSNADVSGI